MASEKCAALDLPEKRTPLFPIPKPFETCGVKVYLA
jgi:hypothetical protein